MKVPIVIEKGEDGSFWGRVDINDNLIVEAADTKDELFEKIKGLIFDVQGITVSGFKEVKELK